MSEDYKQLNDHDLIQWYMNANATCGCLGHNKWERNRNLRSKYIAEIQLRGLELPDAEFAKANGVFNGVGSS